MKDMTAETRRLSEQYVAACNESILAGARWQVCSNKVCDLRNEMNKAFDPSLSESLSVPAAYDSRVRACFAYAAAMQDEKDYAEACVIAQKAQAVAFQTLQDAISKGL